MVGIPSHKSMLAFAIADAPWSGFTSPCLLPSHYYTRQSQSGCFQSISFPTSGTPRKHYSKSTSSGCWWNIQFHPWNFCETPFLALQQKMFRWWNLPPCWNHPFYSWNPQFWTVNRKTPISTPAQIQWKPKSLTRLALSLNCTNVPQTCSQRGPCLVPDSIHFSHQSRSVWCFFWAGSRIHSTRRLRAGREPRDPWLDPTTVG